MNKLFLLLIFILILILIYINNIDGYKLLDSINYINNEYCYNKAYYNTKDIEWCQTLRNNWEIIRDEYINYCKEYELKRFRDIDNNQIQFDIGNKGWYVAFLKVYGSYTKLINVFPTTYNFIKKIPGCTLAMFSTIDAGKVISEHTGPYNGVLRYHLCLITNKKNPEKCYIIVNNIKYHWREGDDVLFDDFMPHCVNNETDSVRVVLFLDIKKDFNKKFINYINSLFMLVACKNITKESIIHKTNSTL